MNFICPRCGESDERYIGYKNNVPYCRRCISFIGENATYVQNNVTENALELNYSLTKEQRRISTRITKNYIDVQAVLSMFVRDHNNNPLSLTHGLEFFNISLKGEPHDPLIDAIHLMHLYKGILKNHDKLYSEYLRILPKQKTLPIPIKNVINDLINGKTVTPNDFEKYVKDYIE